MFLCFLSSGENGMNKSPNPFRRNLYRIQERLGFLFQFHIFFVYCFIPLFPDGNCFFSRSQFLFQTLIVSIGNNAVDRIAFECIALIRRERDISGEGIFLAHFLNILHRQRNGLCCLGFLLQSFQFLFLLLRSSLGIRQTLLGLFHLSGHSFQAVLFGL